MLTIHRFLQVLPRLKWEPQINNTVQALLQILHCVAVWEKTWPVRTLTFLLVFLSELFLSGFDSEGHCPAGRWIRSQSLFLHSCKDLPLLFLHSFCFLSSRALNDVNTYFVSLDCNIHPFFFYIKHQCNICSTNSKGCNCRSQVFGLQMCPQNDMPHFLCGCFSPRILFNEIWACFSAQYVQHC